MALGIVSGAGAYGCTRLERGEDPRAVGWTAVAQNKCQWKIGEGAFLASRHRFCVNSRVKVTGFLRLVWFFCSSVGLQLQSRVCVGEAGPVCCPATHSSRDPATGDLISTSERERKREIENEREMREMRCVNRQRSATQRTMNTYLHCTLTLHILSTFLCFMFTQPQWLSAGTVPAHVLVLCFEVITPPSLGLPCRCRRRGGNTVAEANTPVSSVPVRIRNMAGQDIIADDILVNITTDQMKARLHGVVNV